MPQQWWSYLREVFTRPLLPLGASGLSLGALLQSLFLLLLLFFAAGRLKKLVTGKLLAKTKLDASGRQAVGALLHYGLVLFGFLVILQASGVDVTALSVAAGGLGIGIGFGLQNIANNLVSGLIVLLERPVKLGDRIELAGVEGQVVEIRARSTTMLTNDNIAIIVPNSRFITEEVINWSYSDPKVRFRIPVSVGYDSDVRLVERLLLEVARLNPDVLDDPEPAIRFLEFGDSGLHFELRAWTTTLVQRKGKLVSDLNFAILDAFRGHGITIPYPQRDVHLKPETSASKREEALSPR